MLEIEQLILRLPNMSREEGQQIGQRLAQRLADQLPAQPERRYIDQLNIQLRLPEKWTKDQLVDRIYGAIVSQIQTSGKQTNIDSGSNIQHRKNNEGTQQHSPNHQSQGRH